jgi:cyclopropane fatty-acyl-phospholipid synthase-like methyltransferase
MSTRPRIIITGSSHPGAYGINHYGSLYISAIIRKLLPRRHRSSVGGCWDELGALQFEFLKNSGLAPNHALLDIGCGALRGGVHFVRYLDVGNYYGVDLNLSLLKAGLDELEREGILDRQPHLMENASFELERFGRMFDYLIAQSVFTHLNLDYVGRCLQGVSRVLTRSGRFFATFYEAPQSSFCKPICHGTTDLGPIYSFRNRSFFHQSVDELRSLAKAAGLTATNLGDWGHPRLQRMMMFEKAN